MVILVGLYSLNGPLDIEAHRFPGIFHSLLEIVNLAMLIMLTMLKKSIFKLIILLFRVRLFQYFTLQVIK